MLPIAPQNALGACCLAFGSSRSAMAFAEVGPILITRYLFAKVLQIAGAGDPSSNRRFATSAWKASLGISEGVLGLGLSLGEPAAPAGLAEVELIVWICGRLAHLVRVRIGLPRIWAENRRHQYRPVAAWCHRAEA